jgi:release factor glutamine methyltransferase
MNEMQVESLVRKFNIELKELYDESEIKALTKMALVFSLNISAADLWIKKKEKLNKKQIQKAEKVLHRLKACEPLQYITGETEFLGYKFKVNKNVLVPRPETEELVEWVMEENRNESKRNKCGLKIFDIGTGSGCIAVSLKKKLPASEVTAIDISKDALQVAKKNAVMNNAKINFMHMDILANHFPETQHPFDVIVSNPPYITNHEKSLMHRNVTDYEPHVALFVEGKNPLLFYEYISSLAAGKILNPGGRLYFEMNENTGREIFEMLEGKGFTGIVIKQDLSGKDRMIRAVKK